LQTLAHQRVAIRRLPAWHFDLDTARRTLCEQFGVRDLSGFGAGALTAALGAAGALLHYAQSTQGARLPHLQTLRVEAPADFVRIDPATRRNLEISETLRGEAAPTLLSLLDTSLTAMGSRMLRRWLHSPLRDRVVLAHRHAAIADLLDAQVPLRQCLSRFADIERIAARIALSNVRPRELAALRDSVAALPALVQTLEARSAPRLRLLADSMIEPAVAARGPARNVAEEPLRLLVEQLAAEPKALVRDGGVIAEGFDAELDELRALQSGADRFLLELEASERSRTGIATLRVEFNRVHGFFIEVSQAQSNRVPDDYRRRQTTKNSERYITPALKAFEDRYLSANERAGARERALFDALLERLRPFVAVLQGVAETLAELDVLATFAERARTLDWSAPRFVEESVIEITAGRHPIVEQGLDTFVANDCRLDPSRRLLLITGPNMGGKSTYMRQTALIVLLAQVGAFVPARSACIGPVDQIFTRIGAADDLAGGRSTFMVEMTEAANILHNATAHSLVLMDEIGRGTSTFDGLALAWAIARHLAREVGSHTLFSTHYFELTRLAEELPAVANVHLDAVEHAERIVFLHAVNEGPASQSYGLQVAQLAGVPASVIRAARARLHELEQQSVSAGETPDLFRPRASTNVARTIDPATDAAPAAHAVLKLLGSVDPDRLSARDALDLVYRLAALVREIKPYDQH
ncbi:MAG: DNA mismatch repair protein MutS, partial [Proteobacteria bacterium]|nr:DNA mismatch repair protein MutS [Burkholderiales bacterium]